MTEITRREFLTLFGAAGLGAMASGWYGNRLISLIQDGTLPVPRGAGVETWVPTVCRLCAANCGLRVRKVDGLPVGLEGNRMDPVSAGGLCPAGFSGLQEMVHPDRLRTPMRRSGPRGSGQWTPIGWEDALEEIGARLRRLREAGRPEAFAVLERGDSALTRAWLDRVLEGYGTPNLILDGANEAWRSAWLSIAGIERPPAVDLPRSDFVLSFGHELFDTDGHPVWQSKAWGQLRAASVSHPAVLAFVGPRISPSAARADMRIAVRPGSEAALALGLLHVLIMEDLVNRPFLESWTEGFLAPGPAAGREGLESLVRRDYSPEDVSRMTGAPVREILRLGRALGAAQRPVALAGSAVLHREDGLATASAIIALNLGIGAVGRVGGYVAAGNPPLTMPPPAPQDAVARRGRAAARVDGAGAGDATRTIHGPTSLIANLESGRPYPLEVLLVHGVNPVHEWPDPKAVARALEHVPLVVVTAGVPDETAAIADIILPEAGFLESWNLVSSALPMPFEHVAIQQPAVPPLYQARPFEDLWFALARRIGGPAAATVPAGSFGDWLPEAAAGLFQAGRGVVSTDAPEARIASFVETRGWKVAGAASREEFWRMLRESGSWIDSPEVAHAPEELLERGHAKFRVGPESTVRDSNGSGRPGGDAGPRPAAAERYPLELLIFDTNTLWRGRTALTPLLLELTGAREDVAWDSWVEIHPETAGRLGIRAGERVQVESAAGSVAARARLAPVVPRDAVALPRGLGHRHFGRFANGVGAHAPTLLSPRSDPRTGATIFTTRVRVTGNAT